MVIKTVQYETRLLIHANVMARVVNQNTNFHFLIKTHFPPVCFDGKSGEKVEQNAQYFPIYDLVCNNAVTCNTAIKSQEKYFQQEI